LKQARWKTSSGRWIEDQRDTSALHISARYETVSIGISSCVKTAPAPLIVEILASISAGERSALTPGVTTILFSPLVETTIKAIPEAPSVFTMLEQSTPESCKCDRSWIPN